MADDWLLDTSDSELERKMLRAAADEKVPADVRRRALASLGLLAVAPLGTVSTAAASTELTTATGKALGFQASLAKVGAIVGLGGTVLGVGALVASPPVNEPPRVVSATPASPTSSPKRPTTEPRAAGATDTKLSITSKGRSPWPLHASAPSTCPIATGEERRRPARARPVATNRSATASISTRPADTPLQPAATSIREEIDLLDRARAQLARGNPGAAAEIIAHYFARYPRGVLREEAELVRREARLAAE